MKKLFYLFILVFTICLVCEKRPAFAVDPCLTIDPKTRARERMLILNDEGEAVGIKHAVSHINTVWNPQQTVAQETGSTLILTVRFLDGTLNDRERVRQIAPEWSQHADIRFEFVEHGPSDIRIGFDPNDGNWSYVGSEARGKTKTMNLESVSDRIILHEFGHALSLMHEHQNPTASIPWNEKAIIDEVREKWGWPEPKIKRNILTQLKVDHTNFTAFDPHSIMLYPIPNRWTIGDFKTDYNTALSATDRWFIGKIYDTAAPTVHIPDANLRAEIQKALGLRPEDTLTKDTMLNLTGLQFSSGIADLIGLEHARNLRFLSPGRGTVSDLSPLSGLTQLRDLFISYNNISDVSQLVGMTQLRRLILGGTPIRDLSPLTRLTQLTTLKLWGSSLTDISFLSRLTQIDRLELSGNAISDVRPLANLTRLNWLQLENNNISDLSPLVSNQGLGAGDKIDVTGNPLNTASINTHIPTLQRRGVTVEYDIPRTVNIPDAKLRAKIEQALGKGRGTTITTADMARLTRLNIFNITISSLTGLEHATNLRDLTLNSINITDISALRGLTNLTELSLPANKIVNISAVSRLTNLRSLNLNSNNISDISPVAGLTNLTQLALHSNTISDISPISGLTELRGLILWGNGISDLLPLVFNTGLGTGDRIDVLKNPLNAASINTYIPTLQRRGVTVNSDAVVARVEENVVRGDVNGDSVVNVQDLVLTARRIGQRGQNEADMNGDGVVNIQDLVLVARAIGNAGAAPILHPETLTSLTATEVQGWIVEAEQTALTTPDYRHGIAVLEQLLSVLTPKETILLANYPNPFNPETWIPYHLSNASDVSITIYDVRGVGCPAFGTRSSAGRLLHRSKPHRLLGWQK